MAIWKGRVEGELYRSMPSLADLYAVLKRLTDWDDAESG
jgi:hypothetical protein